MAVGRPPAENGAFAFLSGRHRTLLKCYEMSPLDATPVHILNIDGTDTETVAETVERDLWRFDLEMNDRGEVGGTISV